MNTLSRGRTGAAEDVKRVGWLTITPQLSVPTSFARLNRNPASRATQSIKRTVSLLDVQHPELTSLSFLVSRYTVLTETPITILETIASAPIRIYTRHNGLQ